MIAIMQFFSLVLVVLGIGTLICFSFVLFFGAPFLPTLSPQIITALDLLEVRPEQTLIELGCGDGRVLVAAAKRGASAIGYELNPILAAIAWVRTRRFGRRVKVVCGNFWQTNWPPADAIFAFLLPRYMSKLDKKVVQYKRKPIRLASFAFSIPDRKPDRQKNGIYLYEYK